MKDVGYALTAFLRWGARHLSQMVSLFCFSYSETTSISTSGTQFSKMPRIHLQSYGGPGHRAWVGTVENFMR